DPAVALGDQLFARELLVRLVPVTPHLGVEPLRERLREPVGKRLDHDRTVVVQLQLVPPSELVRAVDPDRERTDRVASRRYVVGETAVRARVTVVGLLAEEAEARALLEQDVVAVRPRRPVAVHPAWAEELAG